jgi:hypothetical protein
VDQKDAAEVTDRLKSEKPFEGLRIFKPKTKRDFEWVAVMGFGVRKLGGVGDSQEEAAIALLEQVLVSTQDMFERAVQYRLVEAKTLFRVRELTTRIIGELRRLHARVVEDHQWETILREDAASDYSQKPTRVEITEDDVGDDFL